MTSRNQSARRGWRWALALAAAFFMTPFASTSAEAQDFDEPWYVTLEAGATGPLNDPIDTLYQPGATGAVGVYRSLMPELALGGRVRAGFLSEGNDIPQDPVDRDVLDYGMIGPALRIRPLGSLYDQHHDPRRATSLYVELAPSLALADGHVIPAYEIGVGYNFAAGPIAIGPSLRFTHMIETEGRFGDHHIATWTAGVEVAFLDEAERILPPTTVMAPPEPRERDRDSDGDWIVDRRDVCDHQPERYNQFIDTDGCPDRVVVFNDALVVDERVFFDFDEADLRQSGEDELDRVIAHYERWGEHYDRLVIIGHADVRGTEPYNEGLSEARAAAVLRYLTAHGVPEGIIDLRAQGEANPEIPDADTPAEHQVNRRVEFRVEWENGERPEGIAPLESETLPEYVDVAPRNRDDGSARR